MDVRRAEAVNWRDKENGTGAMFWVRAARWSEAQEGHETGPEF